MRLRYWLEQGLQTAVTVVVAGILCTMFFTVVNDESLSWSLLLFMVGTAMLLTGSGMAMSLNSNLYALHLPVVLSFGSTRREAILGLHCCRLISAGIPAAIAALALSLGGTLPLTGGELILATSGIFLLFHAAGSILGIVSVKYPKISWFISVIVCTVSIGFYIMVIAMVRANWTLPGSVSWIVAAVGMLTYILMAVLERKNVMSFTVKL